MTQEYLLAQVIAFIEIVHGEYRFGGPLLRHVRPDAEATMRWRRRIGSCFRVGMLRNRRGIIVRLITVPDEGCPLTLCSLAQV